MSVYLFLVEAPISKQVKQQFEELNLPLIDSFGLTEAGPNTFYIDPRDPKNKQGSVGKPILFTKLRLVDEYNQPVEVGKIGQIVVCGDTLYSGYWDSEKGLDSVEVQEEFHTGDLAMMDQDGYFYIMGRIKELIISGGENVIPREVCDCLQSHPLVKDCVVVGCPDNKWGEIVSAAVILNEDAVDFEQKLIQHCRAKLAKYKVPKIIIKMNEYPKIGTGKINIREIARLIAKQHQCQ